jgi:hypothetical protein
LFDIRQTVQLRELEADPQIALANWGRVLAELEACVLLGGTSNPRLSFRPAAETFFV